MQNPSGAEAGLSAPHWLLLGGILDPTKQPGCSPVAAWKRLSDVATHSWLTDGHPQTAEIDWRTASRARITLEARGAVPASPVIPNGSHPQGGRGEDRILKHFRIAALAVEPFVIEKILGRFRNNGLRVSQLCKNERTCRHELVYCHALARNKNYRVIVSSIIQKRTGNCALLISGCTWCGEKIEQLGCGVLRS